MRLSLRSSCNAGRRVRPRDCEPPRADVVYEDAGLDAAVQREEYLRGGRSGRDQVPREMKRFDTICSRLVVYTRVQVSPAGMRQ